MKRIFKMFALAWLVMLGSSALSTASAQYYDEDRDVSYQTFYDDLSPYGRWIEYPGQGYVWVPDAGPDFRPYSTNGHWVYTDDYEWMWVSDYDWGWAPFHYGRWDMDPYYGWYWVPGYEWSPAWVAWRDGGDYYGWAPLRPGINISINFNIGGYAPPNDFWCFAPRRYIMAPRIYDYCVDRRQNITIINQTNIIVNNFRYGGSYGFRSGPRRYDAERYIGRINPVRFRDSYSAGRTFSRGNEVSVYRPNIRRDNTNRQIAPRQFERYDRTTARNDNGGFRRNDNNNISNRGNDLPSRDNRMNNPNMDRRDNNDFRRNNGQDNRIDDRRGRPDQTDRVPDQRNNGNNDRRFDRQSNPGNPNMDQRNNDWSQRRAQQQQQQMDRRQQQPQVQQQAPQQMERQPRQLERQQQQMDRRQQQPQVQQQAPQQMERQPRQFERRQEQQQVQMERRQQQQAPQQMERQQRQSENRENRGGGNGNGNGNGGGRGRRF